MVACVRAVCLVIVWLSRMNPVRLDTTSLVAFQYSATRTITSPTPAAPAAAGAATAIYTAVSAAFAVPLSR